MVADWCLTNPGGGRLLWLIGCDAYGGLECSFAGGGWSSVAFWGRVSVMSLTVRRCCCSLAISFVSPVSPVASALVSHLTVALLLFISSLFLTLLPGWSHPPIFFHLTWEFHGSSISSDAQASLSSAVSSSSSGGASRCSRACLQT